MCGRFALYPLTPSSPSALVCRWPSGTRQRATKWRRGHLVRRCAPPSADEPAALDELWLGYKLHWAGEKAPAPINATVEKVATSNFYKGSFAHHRCLIPADGWYEWLKQEGGKQPYFFCRQDREPIWFAGIWAERADGKPGCAILTEPARGFTKDIHPRMPLALDDESLEPWLDPDLTDRESIRHIVRHLPVDALTSWAVSKRVGSPKNEGEELINPA